MSSRYIQRGNSQNGSVTLSMLNAKANVSHTHNKSDVGLSNVDNTSDVNKPVSIQTQNAINAAVSSITSTGTAPHTHLSTDILDLNTAVNNLSVITSIQSNILDKAPITHTHTLNEVIGLQSELSNFQNELNIYRNNVLGKNYFFNRGI